MDIFTHCAMFHLPIIYGRIQFRKVVKDTLKKVNQCYNIPPPVSITVEVNTIIRVELSHDLKMICLLKCRWPYQ